MVFEWLLFTVAVDDLPSFIKTESPVLFTFSAVFLLIFKCTQFTTCSVVNIQSVWINTKWIHCGIKIYFTASFWNLNSLIQKVNNKILLKVSAVKFKKQQQQQQNDVSFLKSVCWPFALVKLNDNKRTSTYFYLFFLTIICQWVIQFIVSVS